MPWQTMVWFCHCPVGQMPTLIDCPKSKVSSLGLAVGMGSKSILTVVAPKTKVAGGPSHCGAMFFSCWGWSPYVRTCLCCSSFSLDDWQCWLLFQPRDVRANAACQAV
jgi:hypothetical protein